MFLSLFLSIFTLILVMAITIFLTISFYVTIFGGGPFVPTPMRSVHRVLEVAGIKKGQKVYDIGAGDGRFVHFAAKDYGADATGFEMDPSVYFIAKIRQWFWHWQGKMIRSNFQKYSLSDADVVVCYMMPETLAKFQKQFDRELKKGAKVVSYAFHIGTWKPTKHIPKDGKISQIFIYEKK